MALLPDVPGVRHSDHQLPTGVRLHAAEAGDPEAPALLDVLGVERAGYLGHDWAAGPAGSSGSACRSGSPA